MSKTKNDVSWEQLVERHNILDNVDKKGFYEISAARINAVREARLMTYFDNKIQLPKIFQDNKLTIQPISRGTYVIGRFSSYQDLPNDSSVPIEIVSFPPNIETINPDNLFSEPVAILCAHHSGMIRELLGEEAALTVSGRMSTGRFSYYINETTGERQKVSVENSQCEIDGGFEGHRQFALVEAKNEFVNDFLIRQLYYPYRLWKPQIAKDVVPIFLSISDSVFSFYKYQFIEEDHYNSIELLSHRKFQIGTTDIELEDVINLLNSVTVLPVPDGIPFPQADSFSRIIDLLTQLYSSRPFLSQEDITTNHAFDTRQTQYYTNAGAYLGLVERKQSREQGITYSLTPKGSLIMAKKLRQRNLSLVQAILEHEVFNTAFRAYMDRGIRPLREQVEAIMRGSHLDGLSQHGTTIPRRAQTVLAWIDWVIELTRR